MPLPDPPPYANSMAFRQTLPAHEGPDVPFAS
ncbi:hypothetical protein CBM2599_B20133 [Cupriavidus taiwanensis]|uniref:Uncharacterized protein n=2 Tax=Cupriavidus TaxID=106589 RepID=A0A9Q7USW3_9BURK|nr:hypothetical protein CBM2599_B20133 [Cupriavidus taiwanensis]SOZ39728.1 hypothetical protein CBM2605_B40059 [Cupriavidus neocaledonicus]SPD66679.1 protein of unknown function [Cupriavidus taiwanensis]